ncbi:MAG TPA: hypothetical protein VFP61_06725 [Acidimicrobiales bacterium]|nr:hypothetical protein [Acidimicrobiales bacterium]
MTGERWVLLGFARPRVAWFAEVARMATTGVLGAEFVKCLSADDARTRLASGRPHSALLVDVGAPGFDRDLVAAAATAGTAVLAVSDGRPLRWSPADLGVAAVLAPDFDAATLLDALQAAARPVARATLLPPLVDDAEPLRWQGRLVAVCGTGGAGASTVAIALAQAAAADVRHGGSVVLADLARRADQGVLHDAPDVGPGLQELAEAHRLGRPGPGVVRAMTFEVPERSYRLLLGLRRPAAWSTLRPRAADAALEGVRQAFQVTVAQVDADVEGEADGGSIDVEERNHLARQVVTTADAVVVVGRPGLSGTAALGRLLDDLVAAKVDPDRVVPVIVRAPRSPRARAELARALAVASPGASAASSGAGAGVRPPVWVPDRDPEADLRDGAPLHAQLVRPLARAVDAVLDAHGDAPPPAPTPERVAPGSLGTWAGDPA